MSNCNPWYARSTVSIRGIWPRNRRTVGLPVGIVSCLVLSASICGSQPQEQQPIKLLVKAEKDGEVGVASGVQIYLCNTNNRPVAAPKDYPISVQMMGPLHRSVTVTGVIRKAQSLAFIL